ncbi:hypothetical protein Vafri_17538 [Volvox africanus]|uniref:Golgi apparatus protein 1 n=1 Tax=Volvox africanus TaxID=51714 RepID=A0A8J4BL83_9CHLO|nr:hypothetical protein Vafri_17538 [Volvox africanus]
MVACRLWSALCLLAAYCTIAPVGASLVNAMLGDILPRSHRSLQSAAQEVSSPDVPLNGACVADIVQHCRHLLTEEVKAAISTKANSGQTAAEVGSSGAAAGKPINSNLSVVQQADDGGANGQKNASGGTTAAIASAGAGAAAAQVLEDLVADGAALGSRAKSRDGLTGSGAAAGKPINSNLSVVQQADDGGANGQKNASGGTTAAIASAGAGAAAAQVLEDLVADGAALGSRAKSRDGLTGSGAAAGKPINSNLSVVQQADDGGANGQKNASGGTTAAIASTGAGAAAAQTQEDLVADGAALGSSRSGSGGAADTEKTGGAGSGSAVPPANSSANNDIKDAGAAAEGTSNTSTAVATVRPQQQQQQQQQVVSRRRRQLLAGEVDVIAVAAGKASGESAGVKAGSAVAAELNTAAAHSDDLGQALQLLGLRSELGTRAMAAASAPVAKCLLSAMHASEMSISPGIPSVGDECKAQVRSVLIQRASELRYDPPLLAACAHDIVTNCGDVGPDSVAVIRCLRDAKQQLLPLCRIAITARQAAAAEDLSLDPELQRSCGVERDTLCLEAGWGEGAAQACLLAHLRGSLPQVFSEIIFPAIGTGGGGGGGDSSSPKRRHASSSNSGSAATVELSANCSAALVNRLMAEGEDIRFNYQLSSACAGDKQMLCRDVRPGGAAVLRCLERHLDSPDMSEECSLALGEVRQLRSLDVRLDHTFVVNCADDVRSLCDAAVAEQLGSGPAEVPFGLSAPFECLRSRLDLVRDATCRRHMYESIVAAYTDNRLDAGLMRGCHQEVAVLCPQHPPRALECLQGKVSEQCMAVVLERRTQAATDVAFIPDLMEACAKEKATMCSAPGMEGVRALDCLVDRRNVPGFSERCGEALRGYLTEAARDIRTMAGLNKDCGAEIRTLCKGVQPGEGRVISCLRDQRANITGEACRQQVMRLLGFIVEDHRMDVGLTEACTSDVQKYCGGVEAGDGQVHDCLRRSADHLSPECRAAEEEVERLEHEDVRLNPKLMRECPLAVSGFCADVPPGDARVISCLQTNMDKGHFPAGCRLAIRQLTDRAAVKYSLNFRLRQECDDDAQNLCPEAVDELGTSRAAVTGTGGAHREETTLACLARQSMQLAPGCRSELQALVKLSLNHYRVGMPLTSQCDGDVMQRCQVDQVAAPFLQNGYVLSCLAKHAAHLHKPCWELVSTMDEGQFKRAVAAETTAWQQSQSQSQSGDVSHLDEKVLERLVADLRRELEPRIYSNVHEQINRKAVVMARNVTGALVMTIGPRVNALVHTTTWLLGLTAVGLLGGLLAWRKFLSRGGNLLVVRKDGRV